MLRTIKYTKKKKNKQRKISPVNESVRCESVYQQINLRARFLSHIYNLSGFQGDSALWFTSKWTCGHAALINCPVCWERHNILWVLLTGSMICVCLCLSVCVCVSLYAFVCVSVCHCACVSVRIYTQAHVYECECVCVSQCIYVSGWHKYIKGNTQLSSAMFLRG